MIVKPNPVAVGDTSPGKKPIHRPVKQQRYTISINSITPAVFEPAQNRWVQPSPMPAGQSEIRINYTLSNNVPTKQGWVTATMDDMPLGSSGTYPNTVSVMPAGSKMIGEFHGYGLAEGTYKLRITYKTTGGAHVFTPSGQWKNLDSTIAEAVFNYYVPRDFEDKDSDLLDDREEARLIQKFSPYFKYSYDESEEKFRPTDPIWYIRHSKLLDKQYGSVSIPGNSLSGNAVDLVNPNNEIQGASSLYSVQRKTQYRLDMKGQYVFGLYANDGHDWPEIISNGHIGLYAHATLAGGGKGLVKIEYWQFFAYNRATTGWAAPLGMIFGPELANVAGHGGDHAGDWATVQLIIQPADAKNNITQDHIVSVFHYHHGHESRFDLNGPVQSRLIGSMQQFKASDDSWDDAHGLLLWIETPGLYTHPVVYIEWGGHEFWPNPAGSQTGSPKHGGDGAYFYQTHAIPNLGELDFPFGDDARTIMGFNGYWGSFNIGNGNPPGPTLHHQWQWPLNGNVTGAKIPVGDFEN